MTESEGTDLDSGTTEPSTRSKPEHEQGQDVGGPATAIGSGVENQLSGDSSVADDENPDSQSRNPL